MMSETQSSNYSSQDPKTPERPFLMNESNGAQNHTATPPSIGVPMYSTSPVQYPNPMAPEAHNNMYPGVSIGQTYVVQPPQPRNFQNYAFAPYAKQPPSFRANNPNYNGTNTSYGLPSYGLTNYGQDCSKVNTTDKEEIDSALIAALRDPKEKAALLRLEMELLKFMESAHGWMEIAGSYNSVIWMGDPTPPATSQQQQRQSSFQRCVLHRLSDRFGIVREQGHLPGALRLIKVAHSAVPALKLNDIDDDELHEAFSRLKMDGSSPVPPFSTATADSPSKMKIMKRTTAPAKQKPSGASAQTTPKANNMASTLVEREKAYAETRARIFRGDSAATGQGANAGAAPKAVYRNREQEESDPDFRRGSFTQQQPNNSSRLQAAAPAFVPRKSESTADDEDDNNNNKQTTTTMMG